jgi:hypothetical protein
MFDTELADEAEVKYHYSIVISFADLRKVMKRMSRKLALTEVAVLTKIPAAVPAILTVAAHWPM